MPEWFVLLFRHKDKKSPDILGKFPTDVNIGAIPERRYLWTSRIMVIFGAFSICLSMMLATTIYVLLPLRSAGPILYSAQEHNSSLYMVPPNEISTSAQQLLIESALRRYIILRHEIPFSYADLAYRWNKNSEFYQLSSDKVYQQFIYKMDQKQIAKLVAMQMVRQVEINWIKQLSPNLWSAQFTISTTTQNNSTPATAVWRAYIRISQKDFAFDADKNTYNRNPYGVKIQNYSLGYAGSNSQSESYLNSAKAIVEKK